MSDVRPHRKLLDDIGAVLDARLTPEEIEALGDDAARRELLDAVAGEIRREAKARAAAAARRRRARARVEATEEEKAAQERMFQRFNRNFRFQHIVLFLSCIMLILTGMPLKFPDFGPLQWLLWMLGGLESSRLIHRIGASGLIFVAAYHVVYTVLHRDGRRDFWLLLPRLKDVLDVLLQLRYMLGRTSLRPRFGRFSYVEKFDYWAVYWGCVIMIGSGLVLWFQDEFLRVLPKFAMDIATEVHSDEALLATLAIVVWHMYNVHINPHVFPGSLLWWHGKIAESKMKEEHPLELEEILSREESRKTEDSK